MIKNSSSQETCSPDNSSQINCALGEFMSLKLLFFNLKVKPFSVMTVTSEMLLRDLKLLILVALTPRSQMANVAIATRAPLSYDEQDKYGVALVKWGILF